MAKSFFYWAVIAAVGVVAALPGLLELYELHVRQHYRQQGLVCALARGYAREFEITERRKPNPEELINWCVSRFAGDVEKMEFDPCMEETPYSKRR